MPSASRRVCAVVFAVLLVTAPVGGVLAYPQPETGAGHVSGLVDSRLAAAGNQAPLVEKRTAIATVERLNATEHGLANERERTLGLLRGTLGDYRDDTRVRREAVFDNDSKAVQTLAKFDGTDQDAAVETAVQLVVAADNRTAAQAIADAERALNRTEGEVDPRGKRRSAESHLRNARDAFDRAQRTLARAETEDDLSKRTKTRARAIRQMATAWRQAQKALDKLDAGTSPEVTVRSRADPPRNGTEEVTRRVVGDVEDVQAYELENATVRVNDREPITVPLDTPTAPAENATFDVNVSFTDRNTTVSVTVVDAESTDDEDERDRDGRGDGRARGRNGGDGSDQRRQVGTDAVRFDGDGLVDRYEVDVAGTDPLDPDSDARSTDADESNDGVVDGIEDFDDDSVITYEEYVFDTDPFEADSDGDGLPDRVELTYSALDPRSADSDGDGAPDADADPDEDGLATDEEVTFGSHPFRADSDTDRLDDGAEQAERTDPLAPDTDDDGLLDGVEVDLGTDPLEPDSDGNGVPDGEEQFTTTATNESVSTSVDVTGQGDVSAAVSIDREEAKGFRTDAIEAASASPVVTLESERQFEQATVTIGYNESRAGNESDLAVYTFNRSLRTFVRLDSTVDPANDTVTATTSHFSRFVVFNVEDYERQFTAETPETGGDVSQPGTIPVDATFIIDSSGSMRSTDPNDLRKTGAKRFVGALIEGDRAAVVDFDFRATTLQGLTTDFDAVNNSIDRIDSSGGTNIGAGIRAANAEFDRASNASRAKVAILLSDGFTFDESGARAAARAAADRNVTIYTIGFGNPDDDLMQYIADQTGGNYTFVQDVDDLPDVFSRIAENVSGPGDSDGDGIPDARETAGLSTGREGTVYTDPFDADTDNDGVSDGDEAGEFVNVSDDGTNITNQEDLPSGLAIPEETRVTQGDYFKLVSSPVAADTDGDGLTDGEELREARPVQYTASPDATKNVLEAQRNDEDPSAYFTTETDVFSDPYFEDSDFDGLDDLKETELRTNATWFDTDGDGIGDDEEFESGEDPTLFDATPPTVEIAALSAEKVDDVDGDTFDVFDARYTVRYRVSDPSGVTRTKVFKGGEEGKTFTGDDVPTERLDTVSFVAQSFSTFLAETSLGPQVRVRAVDVHGNADTSAQRGPNAFAKAAKVIDDLGGDRVLPDRIEKLGVVGFLAALSGFTYYIASTVNQVFNAVKFAVDIVRGKVDFDPTALYDAMAYMVDNPDVLLSVPGAIADSVQRAQALQNPFPSHPYPDRGDPFAANVDNVTFAAGWYLGGVLGIAAEAFVTAGVASAGKAVGKGLPVVNRVIRAGETASSLVAGTLGVAKQGALLTGRAIVRGTGLALDAVTDAFRRVSVAKQVAIRATIRGDVSDDVVRIAADGGLDKRLIRYLDVADHDEAARLLNALDGSDVADTRRLTRVLLNEDTPDEFQRALARQLSDGDIDGVDARRVLRRIDEASPADKQRLYRVVSEGGTNGAKLVSRTDDLDAVKRFVAGVADGGTELIRRFDEAENLQKFFALDFDSLDTTAWRQNLGEVYSRPSGINVRASDIETYAEDLSVIKRIARDDSIDVDIDGVRGLADESVDGDAGALLGQKLEADRVRYYARQAEEGKDDITRIRVEPGTGDRIDIALDRPSGTEYIEAKNLAGRLDDGRKIKDKFVEGLGSFEESSETISESDTTTLVIGGKRNGVAADLDPQDTIRDGTVGPRESFKNILRHRDQFDELEDAIEGPNGEIDPDKVDIESIRIVSDSGTTEFSVTDVIDELRSE